MPKPEQISDSKVLAFDPGATTGVALIDRTGTIMRSESFSPSETLEFANRMASLRRKVGTHIRVVIEKGPDWQQHSPITRHVEAELRRIFPDAYLVTPSRWKGHPAAKCHERVATRHEKDAVRLARWYQSTHREDDAQNQEQVEGPLQRGSKGPVPARAHKARPGHLSH